MTTRSNIINKCADSLELLVVNLNIRMCLFVCAPENQLVIAEFGLYAFIAWSEEHICIKSDRVSEWFIAKKPGSHFAVDGVEVSMKSSKSRQALTS